MQNGPPCAVGGAPLSPMGSDEGSGGHFISVALICYFIHRLIVRTPSAEVSVTGRSQKPPRQVR